MVLAFSYRRSSQRSSHLKVWGYSERVSLLLLALIIEPSSAEGEILKVEAVFG